MTCNFSVNSKSEIALAMREGRPVLDTFPEHITLTITNICQQRCKFFRVYSNEYTPKTLPLASIAKMSRLAAAKTICLTGSGDCKQNVPVLSYD